MPDRPPPSAVSFHRAVSTRAVLFGPFRFDLLDKTLTRDGADIRLPPRALAILEYLLERPGRVVPKQELIDAVWKDAFVSESSLTEAVGVLRQSLGDSASGAEYIQTVHRRGYRFVAPIQIDAQPPSGLVEAPRDRPRSVQPEEPAPAAHDAPAPRRLVLAAAAAALMIAAAVAGWWLLRGAPQPRVTRTTITLPEAQAPAPGLAAHPVAAISPDGSRIVYVAGSSGSYRLFLRSLDQFEAVPMPGTDGGHGPFFSPGGDAIGFFRRGRLLVMRLPDGQPLDLAEAGFGHGGWWHDDGTILFATGKTDGIVRISSNGGARTSVPVGGLNPSALRDPSVTADGRTLLATLWRLNVRESQVVAVDLERGDARVLAAGVHARPGPAGQVIYLRDNNLVARPLSGAGDERPLLTGVMTGTSGAGQYSLAADGTLLYLPHLPGRMLRQLKLMRDDGTEAVLPFEQRAFQNIAVSPDGTMLATTIYEGGASDLWVGDIARGTLRRLTSEGGALEPVWSADSRTIYFGSTRSGDLRTYSVAADGSRQLSPVSGLTQIAPASEGSGLLLAQRVNPSGDMDILRIRDDGTGEDFIATGDMEKEARLSPDGRWMAYTAKRSERLEIHLRAVGGSVDRQVSYGGGGQPSWSSDGRHLYYVSGGRVQRVLVENGRPGATSEAYRDTNLLMARSSPQGLVVLAALDERRPLTTINVVVNWMAEVLPRLSR